MSEEKKPFVASDPVVVLQMAQRVHDGLIEQAQGDADKIVSDAKAQAQEIISKAQQEADDKMSSVAKEHLELTDKITKLRQFEAQYRQRLSQLVESASKTLEADFGEIGI